MGFVKCLVPICSQLADYTHSTTAVFLMEKSEIPGNISWSRESVVVAVRQGRRHGFFSGGTNRRQVANLPPKYRESVVVVAVRQGRRHEFLSGGTNRRQVANLPPKYPKSRKSTGFGPLHSRIWGRRPLLNFSLEMTRPLRPPTFDAHAHAVKVLRVEKTAKKSGNLRKAFSD